MKTAITTLQMSSPPPSHPPFWSGRPRLPLGRAIFLPTRHPKYPLPRRQNLQQQPPSPPTKNPAIHPQAISITIPALSTARQTGTASTRHKPGCGNSARTDGGGGWAGHLNDKYMAPLTQNLCAAQGKQSPKNLVGDTDACTATHEIRTQCGVDSLFDNNAFDKQILPHKLTIVPKGRPCLNVLENGLGIDDCRLHQPPMVDYPNYSSDGSDYSDLHHLDIKVPGEHTIEGEQFDAEIQMFHVHLSDGRMSSIGVPIRAVEGATNVEFQDILNEFQQVFDSNMAKCTETTTNLRGNSTASDIVMSRNTPPTRFNPYADFLTTMYFYRYDGSITEPPCRDITWWVVAEPLVVGRKQLQQLQRILFGNVDPTTCEPASVHYHGSVARPLQPLAEGKVIQHCNGFKSDVAKGRPPAKQCRE